MALHRGTLSPVTDGAQLRFRHSLQQHRAPYGLGAALAQPDVVLARTALIRIAFEPNVQIGMRDQVVRMGCDQGRTITGDIAAVEGEVDDPLREDAFLRAGNIHVTARGARSGTPGGAI